MKAVAGRPQDVVDLGMSAYLPQTGRQTRERIRGGTLPWVAVGDFLDDWRRARTRSADG